MSGRIVYFEVPDDDADRARKFYADAFGWAIQPMPEMDYTMATTGPVGDQGRPTEPGYFTETEGNRLGLWQSATPA